jgi:hypothetical protein
LVGIVVVDIMKGKEAVALIFGTGIGKPGARLRIERGAVVQV